MVLLQNLLTCRLDLHRVLFYLGEVSGPFVDHLHDSYDEAADEDGHAEDGFGVVAGQLVDCPVEARVRVSVRNVEHLARESHLAGNARAKRKPERKFQV